MSDEPRPAEEVVELIDRLCAQRILEKLQNKQDVTVGDIEAARKYLASRGFRQLSIPGQKKVDPEHPSVKLGDIPLESFEDISALDEFIPWCFPKTTRKQSL